LGNRAVSISITFYTTSSLKSTTRSAVISTLVISGTEVNADSAKRVAVGVDVASGRRSIVVLAACSAIEKSAVRAKSVFVTVEESSSSIAVTISSTFNADSRSNIAFRLVGSKSTISNAVGVLSASLAASVSHAVVTISSGSAAVVISWGGR